MIKIKCLVIFFVPKKYILGLFKSITYALLCLSFSSAYSSAEFDISREWCDQNNGIHQFSLPDHSRVDCLTNSHAIEVEHARKWAEAIGQALFYSSMNSKKPGIVLIFKSPNDSRFRKRLNFTIDKNNLNISVFCVGVGCQISEDD